jgi:rSAM/selenodomain-associated transferase 2
LVKKFSVIIPVLGEANVINHLIAQLQAQNRYEDCQIIVVDGSPEGNTIKAIVNHDVDCIRSARGRAFQMNAGAETATGEILIFLHADTQLPTDALDRIERVMTDNTYVAGAFDLAIDSPRWIYRVISTVASLRSRMTRIPYGDQAIFIRRDAFLRLGGYPAMPIMEDVAFMRLIKKAGYKIRILPQRVATSARRWEEEGLLYTTLRNWALLAAYYWGVPAERLVKYYRTCPDVVMDGSNPRGSRKGSEK